jgi:hypothetical protein
MGIIVGSKTEMECDDSNCKESSQPEFDQTEAVENAYAVGWVKNTTTGKTFCPTCKTLKINLN